jgi:proline dehydrogenase
MAPTAGSTGPSIVDTIPLRLVLLLAAPYLAGKTQQDAIKAAHRLYKQDRFSSTIDILGEDSDTDEECDRSVKLYTDLIEAVGQERLPCSNLLEQITVSMKPSMFSTKSPVGAKSSKLDEAYARIKKVVDCAHKSNLRVTLEAEDHRWTDFHIDSYISLVNEGYTNLGTVLQSRLFRTRNDIKRFDQRMRVRMVIGIYNEIADIAHTEKSVMKELLVEYAGELAKRGTYIELATHDSTCLDNFLLQVATTQRLPVSQFETQFLMGVPRRKLETSLRDGTYFQNFERQASGGELAYLEELQKTGIVVRLYLPFGRDSVAGPYCKRRLKANPNMIGYGIKNLLHIQ